MMMRGIFPVAGNAITVNDRLTELRESLRGDGACVDRIAIAVYDGATDVVRTFADATHGATQPWHYEARLGDVPGLKELAETRRSRFLEDLSGFASSVSPHSRYLRAQGFTASFTQPVFDREDLIGFVFLNSRQPGGFNQATLPYLKLVARVASMMLAAEVEHVHMLILSLETAREVASLRDRETGEHLARIGATSRLLCGALADEMNLDDELCELIYQFAQLHDVGKIVVPNSVLTKSTALSREETELIRSHTVHGAIMIDRYFEISNTSHMVRPIQVLRNIVLHHHEAWDGSGYPYQLAGDKIPIEARIVGVLDTYDALTNKRAYKEAWPHEAAVESVLAESGRKFDPACVRGFKRIAGAIREASLSIGLDKA